MVDLVESQSESQHGQYGDDCGTRFIGLEDIFQITAISLWRHDVSKDTRRSTGDATRTSALYTVETRSSS